MSNNVHDIRRGRSLAAGGEPPHDGGMEARVAKLEVAAEYIQRDVAEIKSDIRDMKNAWIAFKDDVNGEFKTVRSEMKSDFRILFGAIITVALALAGLLAKGFGWV